jgi:hypothetical protein
MQDVYTWSDDMYPIMLERFQDRLDKRIGIIKRTIGYVKLKGGNQYADVGAGGMGLIPKYNGTTLQELDQKRGYKTVYTPEEIAAAYFVSYKYAKTDLSGEARKAGSKCADSLAMTQRRDFYNIFAKGFDANHKGADGEPLFSANHPVNSEGANGPLGKFCNLGTDEFSVKAITKAQAAAQRFKTFDGLDFDCDFNFVGIPPELEELAKRFFGENAKNLPESAENDANPVSDVTYQVMKGLGAKQWFIGDRELMKDYIKMVEITEPTVFQYKPNPLVVGYIPYADYTMGWSDARCVYGFNPG